MILNNFTDDFLFGIHQFELSLTQDIINKFNLYFDEFCRWNRSVNLTGLGTDKEKTVLLFVDSLAGLLALSSHPVRKIVDIGTGGGFPGIPIKLAIPSLSILLMEPRANKTAFLQYLIGKLELTGISVIQKRLKDYRLTNEEAKCDMAMCKGVNIEHILPYINHIVKKDGKLVVFRSQNIDNHPLIKNMDIIEEISYELPFGFGSRVLSVLKSGQ